MKYSICRKFKFDAGHRVYGHEGKCRFPHGHEYRLEVHIEPLNGLDSLGRVIDFGAVKSVLQNYIDMHFDHGFIVYRQDREMLTALENLSCTKYKTLDKNPTAENIGEYLVKEFNTLLSIQDVWCHQLTIWETTNCSATITCPQTRTSPALGLT